MSIAAASVLARIYSDEYMNTIHEEFPCTIGNRIKAYLLRNIVRPLENME
jgi:ribonuclease HII